MTVRRFYVPTLPAAGGSVAVGEASARHARALRLAAGDAVSLFDGEGRQAPAVVERFDRDLVFRADPPDDPVESGPRVVLIQCLPKGTKLETVVRMATEVGVTAIHLAVSDRAVPRPDARRALARVERLARVAQAAARQAGRRWVPPVMAPAPVAEVAARAPQSAARLLLSADSGVPPIPHRLQDPCWLVVGPEGGLGPEETAALLEAGFTAVSLGSTVLRVETAAPVGIALCRDRLWGR